MNTLTFGSLFAGIGGLDLGLERAGMQCSWQVEIDEYASQILAKHWPHVHRERDIRSCGRHELAIVDCICGGFPCQDISNAGRRVGITGERSGLWSEFRRIICELRPRYVLVENVAALLQRGMGTVLGDLAALGYDAEWSVLSACALGAPHTRERLFIVAYTNQIGGSWRRISQRRRQEPPARNTAQWRNHNLEATGFDKTPGWWANQPGVGRVADGISRRMDRLGTLGNAVVPQVAELLGHYIVRIDEATR